jgi:hypothetical protein
VLKPEARAAARGVIRAQQQLLLVQGDKEFLDLVQAALDEMRREPLPRFHLTCTVLVMPLEVAAAHGLAPETDDKVRRFLERAQTRGSGDRGTPTKDVQAGRHGVDDQAHARRREGERHAAQPARDHRDAVRAVRRRDTRRRGRQAAAERRREAAAARGSACGEC